MMPEVIDIDVIRIELYQVVDRYRTYPYIN